MNQNKVNDMMTRRSLYLLSCIAWLPMIATASQFNTNSAQVVTYPHDFSGWSIPQSVGGTSWFDDWNKLYAVNISEEDSGNAYADLTVNAAIVGTTADGATIYATNNPGIGVAYQLNYSTPSDTSPQYATTAPHTLTFPKDSATNGYIHIKYELVRLTAQVPAGPITVVPDVTLNYHNPPGSANPDKSFLARSGVSKQPKMTPCTINAPTEVNLATLYGGNAVNGAQLATSIPTLRLTNCPGAITSMSYKFNAMYGTHTSAEGVMNGETGSGYAQGVFVQFQNADGSGFNQFNNSIMLNYTGSGDYVLPEYKVAYYIDDVNSISTGQVKSALQFTVEYN